MGRHDTVLKRKAKVNLMIKEESIIRGIPKDDIDVEEIKNVIDTGLDYKQWLNDPASKVKFPDINKDIPMANFDSQEMWLARNFADFTQQLKNLGLDRAAEYFLFQLDFLANASLAKGGFARKIDQTTFQKAELIQSEVKEKKFWQLGGKKVGRT